MVALATLTLTAFVATEVDARAGRGGSFGSRGERTYSAPPPTATAPRPSQSLDRSVTQQRPAAPNAAAAQQTRRPNGFMGGLAAGLVGAGIFGLLAGSGFFAGLGSFAGMMGFLLQMLIIGGLIFLVVRFMRSRREATAGAPAGYARGAMPASGPPNAGGYGMGLGAAASARMPAAPSPAAPSDTIGLNPGDYETFEQLLGEIQAAYGRADVPALRTRTTPEMSAYFEQELGDLHMRGLTPRIEAVKLLQGDLSEAWREGSADYATVAMRYGMVDQLFDRNGQLVEGSPEPVEVTELWTFTRQPASGRRWVLSAIQQSR
jgi:predicted lipid-binding transport protein (Tim44 family)